MQGQQVFDFDAWKGQGLKRIEDLDRSIEKSQREINALQLAIDEAQAEKLKIQTVLGIVPPPVLKKPTSRGKFVIKPIIMELFLAKPGEKLTLEQIVDHVREEKPEAPEKSIKDSLERTVKADDRLSVVDGGYQFDLPKPKPTKSKK